MIFTLDKGKKYLPMSYNLLVKQKQFLCKINNLSLKKAILKRANSHIGDKKKTQNDGRTGKFEWSIQKFS